MDVTDSAIRIARCIFEDNNAIQHGAGLCMVGGDATDGSLAVVACVFRDSGSTSTVRGGGAFTEDNDTAFTDCLFHDNTAKAGGAIVSLDAGAKIINCTVAYNTAAGDCP